MKKDKIIEIMLLFSVVSISGCIMAFTEGFVWQKPIFHFAIMMVLYPLLALINPKRNE